MGDTLLLTRVTTLSSNVNILFWFRYVDESQWECRRPSKFGHSQPMANPIITVTEHTPTPSPDFLRRQVLTLVFYYLLRIDRELFL